MAGQIVSNTRYVVELQSRQTSRYICPGGRGIIIQGVIAPTDHVTSYSGVLGGLWGPVDDLGVIREHRVTETFNSSQVARQTEYRSVYFVI